MKRGTRKRDWSLAESKRKPCRICGEWPVELAHTISRAAQDVEQVNGTYIVPASAVVGLCKTHHLAYDAHELDLLPYLTIDEQIAAVDAAGGVYPAYKRLTGRRPE